MSEEFQTVLPAVGDVEGQADSPETREPQNEPEAGETVLGTDVAVVAPVEGTKAAAKDQERVRTLERAPQAEEAKVDTSLPDGAYDSAAFRAANSGARDSFAQMVKRPGFVFPNHGGGGRYVNIFDLNDVVEARDGDVVPEDLYLFPVNYLVREEERAQRTRG